MSTLQATEHTAQEKAKSLQNQARENSNSEEKIELLRSAARYTPDDSQLLRQLAEQLYARGKELKVCDPSSSIQFFEEAEQYLKRVYYLSAREPQFIRIYGVFSKLYLDTLVEKMEHYAQAALQTAKREGQALSFETLVKKVRKQLPELIAEECPDPDELVLLRHKIHDQLLSLCKATATMADKTVSETVSHSLYSLLVQSAYLETLYEPEEVPFVTQKLSYDRKRSLEGFKVRIFGAGITGLTLAYALKKRGANVVGLLDKRHGGQDTSLSKVLSRGQNVSWTDLKYYLEPILGEKECEEFIKKLTAHGAIMDRKKGKLRGTIGAFQEVLIGLLEEMGVKITTGYRGGVADLLTDREIDLQCVATGVHAIEDFSCELQPLVFEEKTCRIRTHLTMYPSDKGEGYYPDSRLQSASENTSWRRVHESVRRVGVFTCEIERFTSNLQRLSAPEEAIRLVQSLHQSEHVAHRFAFGNDREDFDRGLSISPYPMMTSTVKITPWILKNVISRVNPQVPTLFLGDGTCSTHPLAAIGHALVFQNVQTAVRFAESKYALKRLLKDQTSGHIRRLINSLNADCEDLYERQSRKIALMVFLQSCLCSIYTAHD